MADTMAWELFRGLRGAFFRIIVYEEGLEIRAFDHRYFIPYDKIKRIMIEDGLINKKLTIISGIGGIPDYIASPDDKFLNVALLVEMKAKNIMSGVGKEPVSKSVTGMNDHK